ncbi:creatininase family protein [Cohnella faecalis]|uniref:Creatininase family protein n=1 Tax=Cohnella faecalis TaxID=2315694 RepID=A0A398CB90_9BACL|nr:creatininase family protein [Cohnella faecalis]RIE00416.1 creatininase family protein [Cohnella faecalis]
MKPNIGDKTLWAELLPFEFNRRLAENPVVYLPLGICEPHGQVSAFGLDTFKAEWLCTEAAKRMGGIVAPSLGYHIHETGYHARWLQDEIGEEKAPMTAMPPDVFLLFFLYQLRAFVNSGFRTIVVVSGHSGGNQRDLRLAADIFMKYVPVQVWVCSDPELVEDLFEGDHAGKYEISQLMYIKPPFIDMALQRLEKAPGSGGRLALGLDASEANEALGKEIMEACLARLCDEISRLQAACLDQAAKKITPAQMEVIRGEVLASVSKWVTTKPWPEQQAVGKESQWKPFEYYSPF